MHFTAPHELDSRETEKLLLALCSRLIDRQQRTAARIQREREREPACDQTAEVESIDWAVHGILHPKSWIERPGNTWTNYRKRLLEGVELCYSRLASSFILFSNCAWLCCILRILVSYHLSPAWIFWFFSKEIPVVCSLVDRWRNNQFSQQVLYCLEVSVQLLIEFMSQEDRSQLWNSRGETNKSILGQTFNRNSELVKKKFTNIIPNVE